MRDSRSALRSSRQRGIALVEFSLSAVVLFTVVLAGVEFGRMVLVYTTLSNAARAGVRYASVHGAMRDSISGVDGASGPSNSTQVVTMVKNFASTAPLNLNSLTVTVDYPDGTNAVGSRVTVSVVYPYDPFTAYLPLRVNIGSTTQAAIAF